MNQSQFFENFAFRQYRFRYRHLNDASLGNDCHFIGFMRKGQGILRGEDIEICPKEGELFYIPMGYHYRSEWYGEDEICFDSYAFSYFPLPSDSPYPLQIIPTNQEVLERLNTLASHRQVDCFSIGSLYLLLDELLPLMQVRKSGGGEALIHKSIGYMQTHTKLNVSDLARYCRVSESGLYAAFRSERNCTPIAMWHRVQIEKAVNLLFSTDLSVEEIAARLEFCSASYFRKIFKEITGQTPREVRRLGRV